MRSREWLSSEGWTESLDPFLRETHMMTPWQAFGSGGRLSPFLGFKITTKDDAAKYITISFPMVQKQFCQK